MRQNINFFLWIFTLLAVGGWVGWMKLDNQIPYEYLSGVIKPDPVEEGRRVTVEWDIRVHRVCPVSVQRTLSRPGTTQRLAIYDPLPYAETVRGNDVVLPKSFVLPEDADLIGAVQYDAHVCFRCNALHYVFPICTNTPSITFTVEPRANNGRR